ncbi:hypothetical protein [Sphingomonas sp. CROZ-RG-20F-R02-07]|uniref:hypothetical protein n=1 Tax=Sphingomonas sp. CROZ-RG-20F-R02-07 TaxID=2914832 RepID=UPI001F59271A|nr:hypothetical protein [Sphingomonas sp. CROZ-RG-20F-R02-07]
MSFIEMVEVPEMLVPLLLASVESMLSSALPSAVWSVLLIAPLETAAEIRAFIIVRPLVWALDSALVKDERLVTPLLLLPPVDAGGAKGIRNDLPSS